MHGKSTVLTGIFCFSLFQKPIDVLIKQPKEFIPNETLRGKQEMDGFLADMILVQA